MEQYIEHSIPEASMEVLGSYDVVVCGGGIAGVASALAAKRNGSSVVILEKGTMLGGLATMGLITWYLALCDGKGRKIISGIAEELLYKSIQYGYDTLPEEWRGGPKTVENASSRYVTRFSPAEFATALEEMMIDEGIKFVYDTQFTRPIMNQGVCEAVLVEELGGCKAYRGKVFIDATGDCDLAYRAGAKTAVSENNLSYWVYKTDLEKMKTAVKSGNILDALDVHWYGDTPGAKNAAHSLMTVTNAADITKYVMLGRRLFLKDIQETGKGKDHTALCIASMPQIRMTRRIEGAYVLSPEDVNQHMEDSIGAIGDWRKAGPVYEIPFRALYSSELKNILNAGRCISSEGDAWDVTRAIPPSALTGQAAGTAAAFMAAQRKYVTDINISDLQDKLNQDGVMIHF